MEVAPGSVSNVAVQIEGLTCLFLDLYVLQGLKMFKGYWTLKGRLAVFYVNIQIGVDGKRNQLKQQTEPTCTRIERNDEATQSCQANSFL